MPRAKGKGTKKAVAEAVKGVEVDEVVAVGSNGFEAVVGDSSVKSYTVNGVEDDEAPVKAATGRGGRGKRAENKVLKEELSNKKPIAKGRGRVKKSEDIEVISEEVGENGPSNGVGSASSVVEKQQEVIAKSDVGKGRRGKKAAAAKELANENGEVKVNNKAEAEVEMQDVAKTARGRGIKKAEKDKADEDLKEAESEAYATKTEDPEKNGPAKKVGGRKKKNDIEKGSTSTFDTVKDDDESENTVHKTEQTADAKTAAKKQPTRKKNTEEKVSTESEILSEKEINGKSLFDILKEETVIPATSVKQVDAIAEAAESNENVQAQKKLGKRGAKDNAKKPATKRGAKAQEITPVEDDVEVDKKPVKRGRGATPKTAAANTIEEVTDIAATNEEAIPKKRSRKEISIEKELKPEVEKPKKAGRGKQKAEKLEDVNEEQHTETDKDASEVNGAPAGATEDSLSTIKSEKVTNTNRGGRKRAAPTTNKSKAAADDDADDKIETVSATASEATALEKNDDDEADGAKSSKSKKRKKEPSTKLAAAAPMNATSTLYSKEDFQLAPLAEGQTADEPRFNFKISSWNVAGLRAWLKKDGLRFLEYEEPDIFCLQETKCALDQLPEEVTRLAGYHPYWLCMPGGYAGVAIYSKIMPINVEYGIGHKEFDDVGRVITAEYEKFFLINVYVPNSGRKLVNLEARMKWEKLFQEFVQKYNANKPVVICGDMNVSHQEIDLANPKTNTRNAGFTKEERDKMTELLSLGYVDTFRHLYPDRKGAYTFWTYMGNARTRNVGWRLDYFIVAERFVGRVVDNCIRSQCMGSDHCPITLFLKM